LNDEGVPLKATENQEGRANGRDGTRQSGVSSLLFPQCPCGQPEKRSPAPVTDGESQDRPDPYLNHGGLQVPGLRPRVERNLSPVNLLASSALPPCRLRYSIQAKTQVVMRLLPKKLRTCVAITPAQPRRGPPACSPPGSPSRSMAGSAPSHVHPSGVAGVLGSLLATRQAATHPTPGRLRHPTPPP